ncbi:MAG: type IV toxin-antitoxin system AbiEi family antitoxin domain-containing protein [Renibacterium salmoninarum]|nr:type IV toxin-antitoxin system AbiEi family antitoxin domain-containing protein [Renibacterium salmoninarum]
MADPVAVLNRMAGCGRWRDLLLAGVPESALRRAVESGAVVRHGSGVYASPGTSQQRIAVYRAAGVPACLNAAQDRGWWILQPPTTPHIAVDHGRPVPEVVKHRSRLPLSALDIVLQVLHCAPEELMGKEFHLSAAAFEEDLRRFNQYTVSGVPVLRVGYAQVIYRPAEFIALVRQALATISATGSH